MTKFFGGENLELYGNQLSNYICALSTLYVSKYTGRAKMAYWKETVMRVWRRNFPFVSRIHLNTENRHLVSSVVTG